MGMMSEPTLLQFGNGGGARTSQADCRHRCSALGGSRPRLIGTALELRAS